jgi:transcriptional regulator with XRE-family HTH domain
MNKKMKQARSSREWLKKMADAEERYVSVTVGGLASDFGMLPSTAQVMLPVFGQFIEFARRKMDLSIEEFADEADIDLDELLAIEYNIGVTPTLNTVQKLAKVLDLSPTSLMELAGLVETSEPGLKQAALRFAARAEPTAKLSKVEREAYEDFVQELRARSSGD